MPNSINLIQIRNDHIKGIQGLSEFAIDVYGRINFQNQYINILSVLKSKSKAGYEISNWHILSLDSTGKFISNMNKVDEFKIMNDTIVCLWYYASDNFPTYETWIQNKEGIYNMIKQDTIKPKKW